MRTSIKVLAVTGLALAAFSATSVTASAKHHYTTIPKSLRGTCGMPRTDQDSSKLDKVKFTKYGYYWKMPLKNMAT